MIARCKNCYFMDNCANHKRRCSDYSPIIDEMTDKELDMLIEQNRNDFFEWFMQQLEDEDRMQDFFG